MVTSLQRSQTPAESTVPLSTSESADRTLHVNASDSAVSTFYLGTADSAASTLHVTIVYGADSYSSPWYCSPC